MEPVFRALEIAAKTLVKTSGTTITYSGLDHIPPAGGAVIAINHTSYIDFLPAALAVHRRGRRMRFMIKAEMQQVRSVNFLIKHTKTIPVDRRAGAGAYAAAVEQLRAGEVIGVYPESTISRSFELKDFKSGAARMALEAQVPIVPLIVWGAQRIWTKDHPRTSLFRNKIPISVAVGPAVPPAGDVEQLGAALREEMSSVLDRVQRDYPHPAGAHWVPRRLGGSAPTLAEAKRLDEAELAERAARAGQQR
ncbi:lysophospholipid acyltransferase family protein [Mycobacterium talmoniae]|uniref:1-acyl-sn-glycerol-3-phosphate acyltransferase n=1 Tax=Mycobacterium talmoniae TaxID=1858794 RepID=A0A1S1NPH7_9MYCO|nr:MULTISPECIES: lysophospholipid acyltransferase family protein [Mycobacterium]OHV04681.1 1-acyl-sn-glycerol-3-phosphate acyltransferase [Mycobacterium talmoniae]PQM49643.1 1-acyl-sn-glycerol-3-phosphate acyltransferase [Mycobacterium talmoniae]TDH51003.1 1-acyl-sn-glycerol-3-phosphate acyltransferase [Mycobacterium eburneum]